MQMEQTGVRDSTALGGWQGATRGWRRRTSNLYSKCNPDQTRHLRPRQDTILRLLPAPFSPSTSSSRKALED